MLPTFFRIACVMALCALCIFAVQPGGIGYANPPSKDKKAPKPPATPKRASTPKPTPRPTPKTTSQSNRTSAAVATSTRRTPTATGTAAGIGGINNMSLAGMAFRSQSWYRHHRYHRMVYEVRFRSTFWHERIFASSRAARTYMVYLRHHQMERRLFTTEGLWVVAYRNVHSRHFGTYAYLPVARRVEAGLTLNGIPAWVVSHRLYF